MAHGELMLVEGRGGVHLILKKRIKTLGEWKGV